MESNNNEEVKYCVTAVLDLLGFTSHLEVGRNDLRTNIGHEAIRRLETLEESLRLLEQDKAAHPNDYPERFYSTRINDAIIFTLDLPDFFRPEIGESIKRGVSLEDLETHFDLSDFKTVEEFKHAFGKKMENDIQSLAQFIGFVARVHVFINDKENAAFFPGAKTIISSGYRRSFKIDDPQDFLSANFSFSNAVEADKNLHGPRMFVDSNVAQLLCANPFARNLVKFGCYVPRTEAFDPFRDYEDLFFHPGEVVKSEPVDVNLFRISFSFGEMNPIPLQYLQVVPRLSPFLNGNSRPNVNVFWLRLFERIQQGPAQEPASFSYDIKVDIGNDLWLFSGLIERASYSPPAGP
jgi:hypothetical protein